MRRVVVALCVVAMVAGCGGGSSRSSTGHTRSTSCIAANGYGGLGASTAAFDPNNNGVAGQGEPTPGAAWYQVAGTDRGCVTAYTVQETGTPPLRARDMLALVSRAYLPADAKVVVREDSCVVWRSWLLNDAVGLIYARATASPQGADVPGTALIVAIPQPSCRLR